MAARRRYPRGPIALAALFVASTVASAPPARALDPYGSVPRASCAAGDHPERGLQGQVTAAEVASGYAATPITCNAELAAHHGTHAGLKVARYVDKLGHECAYYDTEVTFPLGGPLAGQLAPSADSYGTYVLHVNGGGGPVLTSSLRTPAMVSPHESLLLNAERGLLVAVMGNAVVYPGFIDVYDVSVDCRFPVLLSSTPTGILGHESGFSPDGRTFWASSLWGGTITAVDLADPANPRPIWVGNYFNHGLSISDDGNRAYLASTSGLKILDVSQVQARFPEPRVTLVSELTWETMSIPQSTWPVTIGGRPYVIEMDEFGSQEVPGAARIIDIANEREPVVVSNLRLEVHDPEHFDTARQDPGGTNGLGGYAGHYCDVPRRTDPGIVACTFILSGLRVFDIRDPHQPREIAYFNAPQPVEDFPSGNYAMSNVAFAPERGEVWYTDSQSGFWAVRLTNDVWPRSEPGSAVSLPPALP